ncbi:MAG: hypothetical protein GY810_32565 [Aureispira sp.]|nr:hypothetical protein [Aureispira sp.]
MYKLLTTLALLLLIGHIQAQEDEKPPSSVAVDLVYDNTFGFYPEIFGSIGVKKNFSFSFYGIYWTNPAYGSINLGGTDGWLETGIGAQWFWADGKVLFNPSIGVTHGKLLSGGERSAIAEGIVPNIELFYFGDRFELEFFNGYYKSIRKEGPVTTDFWLTWAYPGVFVHKNISLGVHYEHFIQTRVTGGEFQGLYYMLGGYIKASFNNGIFLRFSAGYNFVDESIGGYGREFYRLATYVPFTIK